MRLTKTSTMQRGFTLTELLVGIAIVAILLGVGVPSIASYLQSAKLNSAAQSYLSGVQAARSEAIRRNARVEFILTDTPTNTVTLAADNVVPSATGQNWVVRAPDPAAPPAFLLVESRSATEGSASIAAPSVTVLGTGSAGFTGTVTFNGFGGTADGNNYQLDLQNPAGGACAPTGPMRCPRVLVPAGGLARLCDPQAGPPPADTRGC